MTSLNQRAWQIEDGQHKTFVELTHDVRQDRIEIVVGGFPSPFQHIAQNEQGRFLRIYISGQPVHLRIRTADHGFGYDLMFPRGSPLVATPIPMGGGPGSAGGSRKSFWQALTGLLKREPAPVR